MKFRHLIKRPHLHLLATAVFKTFSVWNLRLEPKTPVLEGGYYQVEASSSFLQVDCGVGVGGAGGRKKIE